MKYTWLLDAGHSGLLGGVYSTPGKRSPKWEDGVYYEGVGNRDFVRHLKKELDYLGIASIIPYDTELDLDLNLRDVAGRISVRELIKKPGIKFSR